MLFDVFYLIKRKGDRKAQKLTATRRAKNNKSKVVPQGRKGVVFARLKGKGHLHKLSIPKKLNFKNKIIAYHDHALLHFLTWGLLLNFASLIIYCHLVVMCKQCSFSTHSTPKQPKLSFIHFNVLRDPFEIESNDSLNAE